MIEYTELEEAQSLFSDMYKDVHGFRPRWCSKEQWDSIEFLNEQIEYLSKELEIKFEEDAIEEKRNIAIFEQRITDIINTGAGDRQTALRWILDAENDEYVYFDLDYFCYTNNLPYGYLKDFKRS